MATTRYAAIDINAIMRNILVIRGHRVLHDSDLAALYQVETKALTRAVRRNAERFPRDFMFQLAVVRMTAHGGQGFQINVDTDSSAT
jgi:hypothetical protein